MLQTKELLPVAIEIVPFPPVRPVDAATWGLACTTRAGPHAPLIELRTPRLRHVQNPGFPASDTRPGAEPVEVTTSPPDTHDSSHDVESAPSRPTRTATLPAVAARHGVRTGAAGAMTPLNAGGADSIWCADTELDLDSMTAPWAKFVDDVHGGEPAEQRTVPEPSRTSETPPGSLSSHLRCVPDLMPGVPTIDVHETDELVRDVIVEETGARTVKRTVWYVSSVGVPRLSGTRMRPRAAMVSGPDHVRFAGE